MRLVKVLVCFVVSCSWLNAEEPTKILITGSFSPAGMERIGKPITIVDRKDLDKNKSSSVTEALEAQPGVSTSSYGPGASRPIVRGLSKERVRVLENGLEAGDASAVSDDHPLTTDPLSSSRIDVLRGSSTLLFGSQAIGGVVNVVDDSIKETGVGKPFGGQLRATLGDDADDEESIGLILEGEASNWNWYLSAYSRSTENIEIPGAAESSYLMEREELEEEHDEHEEAEHEHEDESSAGVLENSDTDSEGVKVGLSKTWDDGFVGFSIKRTDNKYGIPGAHEHGEEHEHQDEEEDHDHDEFERSGEEEEENVRIDAKQTRIETRGALHLHEGYVDALRFGLAYSNYEHDELEGSEVGTNYSRDAIESRFLLTHVHEDLLEGGLGFQLNHDSLEVTGDEAFIPDTDTFSPAIFMVEDFKIDKNWVWQLGGRYEFTRVDPIDAEDEDFHAVSASTGIIWHNRPKTYNAALSFSYSERAPNGTELFANGAHIANQSYEIGDANLSEEKAIGSELIFRKLGGPVRGSAGVFIQEYSDFINLEADGTERESFPVFQYEQIDARLWGYELEAEFDLVHTNAHKLTFHTGLDQVRAKNLDNDRSLPRITPRRYLVGLDYSYKNFSSYVNTRFVDEQRHISEFELPTDSYHLLNAGVSVTVTGLPDKLGIDRSVELFLKGTNLTDEEARVHTSFLKDRAPLRGRAIFAGINAYF